MPPPTLNTQSPPPGKSDGRTRSGRRAWLGALACGLTVLLAPASSPAADSGAALEYKVKAGYLFNFAKFIEWPAAAVPATNSPIVIGVLDDNEALPAIRQVLKDKFVGNHPIEVRSVVSAASANDCHLLFVTRAANKAPDELRDSLRSAATLLVGETDQFAERGGMIAFVREEESVRINLNLEAATQAGLKVSAKLSSVARLVKTKPTK